MIKSEIIWKISDVINYLDGREIDLAEGLSSMDFVLNELQKEDKQEAFLRLRKLYDSYLEAIKEIQRVKKALTEITKNYRKE